MGGFLGRKIGTFQGQAIGAVSKAVSGLQKIGLPVFICVTCALGADPGRWSVVGIATDGRGPKRYAVLARMEMMPADHGR